MSDWKDMGLLSVDLVTDTVWDFREHHIMLIWALPQALFVTHFKSIAK